MNGETLCKHRKGSTVVSYCHSSKFGGFKQPKLDLEIKSLK